ncbi:MAG: hypothetical protein M5U13_02975 [Thermoanaerobaculia bacterium]|nr:hypothetical protein [Thermoanaerobaculia bacterium]
MSHPHRLSAIVTLVFLVSALAPSHAVRADTDSPETLAEQAAARAAESETAPRPAPPAVPAGAAGGPLFVGVDDTTIFTFRIDPGTNIATPQFDGFQAWGAAYDPVGDQVYFNNGSVLYVWPVGGAVATVGTIVDGAGATQSMVGLAFHNGTLYGTKNIANEAIWSIDTTTAVATVHIDYVDADLDCGGFAVDPSTGDFYCTNDDATPHGSGLVRINPDASVTLITPYPAGQTDIDGLAIGGGRAYLVIDEPGSIYVWDFGTAAYVAPLTAPWTTSEVFSAGTWIPGAPAAPAISLVKTVGTDPTPGACPPTTQITVPAGTTVYYCYSVTNTGDVAFTTHDLVDSELGPLLTGFAYNLVPGASAFLPDQAAVIQTTTTNTATWTATAPGVGQATAEASATVEVEAPSVLEIPTLGPVGAAALALGLAGLGLGVLRRRRT